VTDFQNILQRSHNLSI